jgi:hypothetical protein
MIQTYDNRVEGIARANGYGGFYMTNCWAYVSTDPEKLREHRFNETI